ncbi:hypothetical protein AB1Y20_004921 [Prymnesium parvum]|uniref:DUF4476 domain-containing protein n=1 Tax=Prymnesium parvum TaxID=97485 RepID=A0AB34IXR3_PRYPA
MAVRLAALLAPLLAGACCSAARPPSTSLRTSRTSPSPRVPPWPRRRVAFAAFALSVPIDSLSSALSLSPASRAHAFVAGSDRETSGLVVLRVAEVCDFQEKLLRSIGACSTSTPSAQAKAAADQFGNLYCGEGYQVNPGQILYGTGVMLRNSNLDGNMKLMISAEIPRSKRDDAVKQAVTVMNTFNRLIETAGNYSQFEGADYFVIAGIYSDARAELARFFDLLPPDSQARFFNFADEVRKYEEKVSREDGIERMKQ